MCKYKKIITLIAAGVMLNSCALPQAVGYKVSHSLGADAPQSAPSITHEKRKIGNPYSIPNEHGIPITYYPIESSVGYKEDGIASWYGYDFHAKKTANGEDYNMYAYTAAHKTLPLPTYVRVTNKKNGKSIVVRVNDRGPFYKNRVIDMSYAGAKALGFDKHGVTPVTVEAISIYGGDTKKSNSYTNKSKYQTNYSNSNSNARTSKNSNTNNSSYSLTRNNNSYKAPTASANAGSSFTNRVSSRNQNVNSAPKAKSNTNNVNIASSINSAYYIQLGSFTDINNARKLYYKAKHLDGIKIKSILINNSTYYRVVIENINDLSKAERSLAQAKSSGFYNAIIQKRK